MVDWGALDYANRLGQAEGGSLYQGIVRLIRGLIAEGQLSEGDTLPTQRDFAAMAGISRGTVSLAYDELRRDGILTAVPGRGSVVASDRYVSPVSRKEQAIRLISNALEKLEALGFSSWEIETFLHLVLQERSGHGAVVRAALIDCNPEALRLMEQQLNAVSHLDLTPLLLDEFLKHDSNQSTATAFDLYLTTESHAPQVIAHLARLQVGQEKCMSLAVSPTSETLIALARLPEDAAIVVRTESRRFAEIIQQQLGRLGCEKVSLCVAEEGGCLDAIQEPKCLVVPRSNVAHTSEGEEGAILFNYQVDRGSILRVEEAVTALLLQKGEGILAGR